uniref:Serine and arginine repetitive matrix 1 n=1 Tax=Erpetoichthys calabaricus TaxID=27687 RepID=A0A8C4SX00_ERPCA
MDAGFFRGTSAEQDNRFSNKQKKLLKQLKFAECLEKKVDMTKVNLEVIKPWITQRVTEILGFEDDVVIEFIFNQLEEKINDITLNSRWLSCCRESEASQGNISLCRRLGDSKTKGSTEKEKTSGLCT